mmetsp:Transcript_8398/g.20137  ORF Transcript_8398/g.20137 Transcript_8398/m.20137 type:complete len:275 (-) Transcript_8398:182-1006(-)
MVAAPRRRPPQGLGREGVRMWDRRGSLRPDPHVPAVEQHVAGGDVSAPFLHPAGHRREEPPGLPLAQLPARAPRASALRLVVELRPPPLGADRVAGEHLVPHELAASVPQPHRGCAGGQEDHQRFGVGGRARGSASCCCCCWLGACVEEALERGVAGGGRGDDGRRRDLAADLASAWVGAAADPSRDLRVPREGEPKTLGLRQHSGCVLPAEAAGRGNVGSNVWLSENPCVIQGVSCPGKWVLCDPVIPRTGSCSAVANAARPALNERGAFSSR